MSQFFKQLVFGKYIRRIEKLERELEEKTQQISELEEQVIHDDLTGLYTKNCFYTLLEAEMSRSKREGTLLTVALADIRAFGIYNQQHGHVKGDIVLEMLGGIIKKDTRIADVKSHYRKEDNESTLSGRFGGDEFFLAFPNTTKENAGIVMGRIATEFYRETSTMVDTGNRQEGLTLSYGLYQYNPSKKETAEALVNKASLDMSRNRSEEWENNQH